jgi:hypothetical protein
MIARSPTRLTMAMDGLSRLVLPPVNHDSELETELQLSAIRRIRSCIQAKYEMNFWGCAGCFPSRRIAT